MRFALLLAVLTMSPPSLAQEPVAPEVIQQRYLTYLKSKGLEGGIDSDGDVTFSRAARGRELSFFIDVDPKDTQYFTVVLPNIWKIESEAERTRVLKAVDKVNRDIKVAKASTVNDNVWISIELFVAGPNQFAGVFERSLTAIDDACDLFVQQMN